MNASLWHFWQSHRNCVSLSGTAAWRMIEIITGLSSMSNEFCRSNRIDAWDQSPSFGRENRNARWSAMQSNQNGTSSVDVTISSIASLYLSNNAEEKYEKLIIFSFPVVIAGRLELICRCTIRSKWVFCEMQKKSRKLSLHEAIRRIARIIRGEKSKHDLIVSISDRRLEEKID